MVAEYMNICSQSNENRCKVVNPMQTKAVLIDVSKPISIFGQAYVSSRDQR